MSRSTMSREQFKERWESNDNGGGITFDDVADCAVSWGLFSCPRIHPINKVLYQVLVSANTNDCEEFKPQEEGGVPEG